MSDEYEPINHTFRNTNITTEDLEAIAKINQIYKKYSLLTQKGSNSLKNRKQLNKDAVELKKIGFNATAPSDLLNSVLEEFSNITITIHLFQKNTSGIGINSDMNLCRQRFTFAYALYYLLSKKALSYLYVTINQ